MALYLACRDPRVPWYGLAILVVAYAFSPIALIPDIIPVLGYLDDVILLPLGIWLVLKIIPPAVIQDCRQQAQRLSGNPCPKNWIAAGVIGLIWLVLGIWIMRWVFSKQYGIFLPKWEF